VLVSYHPSLTEAGSLRNPNVVPTSGGQIPSAYAETGVLPWNDQDLVEEYLTQHPGAVAAIITEPILCNSGCILPQPGFLQSLRQLADRFDVLLIFDEVITGFRVALGGAEALYGITPDLAVFGKAVAGGFPLSVIAGKDTLIREVDRGRVVHAGTFNGNPIVLAAALATLQVLQENDGASLKSAEAYGHEIIQTLTRLAAQLSLPLQVLGHGTVFRPIFGAPNPVRHYRDFAQADLKASQGLTVALFNHGIYCVPDGRWYVSGVHGPFERDAILSRLPEVLQAVGQSQQ